MCPAQNKRNLLDGKQGPGVPRPATSSTDSVDLGPTTPLSRNDRSVGGTTTGSNSVSAVARQQTCSGVAIPGLSDYAASRGRPSGVVLTSQAPYFPAPTPCTSAHSGCRGDSREALALQPASYAFPTSQ